MGLLDQILLLIFWGITVLFSIAAVPFHLLSKSLWGLHSFSISSPTLLFTDFGRWGRAKIGAALLSVRWFLICSFYLHFCNDYNVGHLFIFFFKTFIHFWIRLFAFIFLDIFKIAHLKAGEIPWWCFLDYSASLTQYYSFIPWPMYSFNTLYPKSL